MFDKGWELRVAQEAPEIPTSEAFVFVLVLSTGRGVGTTFAWRIAGGSLTTVPEVNSEVDVTVTVSPADAELIVSGQLPVAVAFMQGRLKPVGDNGLWLRLAKLAQSLQFDDWRERVSA